MGAIFAVMHHLPRAHAARAVVAWDGRQVRLLNSVPQNWRRPCTAPTPSTMHCNSKSCRKLPERTMTRSDIFKLVNGMRSKKQKEKTAWYDCSESLDVSQSQEPSSNEDLGSQGASGVNVCIFPCNNPIEHVIAECYRHAKHSREGSAAETSQSSGNDDLSSSACETLLSQVAKKIEELQAEMKLYQAQNEQLKNMQQQYHQMMSKLQKDKEEFDAHKEKETKKLQSEIEEEKRKMRIQKRRTQTLSMATKVEAKPPAPATKDKNKENDGQLQRKVALLTSENGRLKNKLQLAEQEKESLKALVKELEEQRIGLLEKLEKASELNCYPSLNELAMSPTSHLIMPMLVAPPSSPFQAEGIQQALESAHGDSLCVDTKNCKEASFELSSKVHPHDILGTTGPQASEPSVVISATVVTRLSLDSCLSSRSPIASPLGLCKREICNAVSWNSVQQLEQNANVEECTVLKPALRHASSQVCKTVRFATDLHASCSDSARLDGLSRAVTDDWSPGGFPNESIHTSEVDTSRECSRQPTNQADVCVSSFERVSTTQRECEVPAARAVFTQNDAPSDFVTKVTKVGLVTKEILTNTSFKKPSAEMMHWNVAVPKLLPQPSSSSTTVELQDQVLGVEPTVPQTELQSVRSVAPKAAQSNSCIKKPSQANVSSTAVFKGSKKSSTEDVCALSSSSSKDQVAKRADSCEESEQGRSRSAEIVNVSSTAAYETSKKSSKDTITLSSSSSKHQVARKSDSCEESEQNGHADASVAMPEQAGRGSCEVSEQSRPVSDVEVMKEANQLDWEPGEECEHSRRAGSDTNVSTKGGDHSEWESYEEPTEQSQLVYDDDCFTKGAGLTERETASRSKCETAEGLAGSQECNSESDGTGNSLREILKKLGGHFPVPASSSQAPLQDRAANRLKRPGDLASLPHLPTETKVSSLIKKYSQVNASSQESSAAAEMRRARKSHSVQIQSPSRSRDGSPSKSASRTWALDSNGQKMFLTVVSKEIDPFTQVIVYKFQNGDEKHMHPDGKVVYHYAKSETIHTVYPCGKKEIKFANGQVETHTKGGDVEVTYPDGTVRRIFSTGEEEQQTVDGIVARRLRDGTETIDYPNGQREVRSELYRSRYYPNGTVKTVYTDGKQVTRFPNGRVRVKEADGTVCSS